MSKMPMAWHEECLKNSHAYLTALERRAIEAQKDVDALRCRIEFEMAQFQEAERRGLDGYDSDRFMQPKKMRP